MKKKLLMLHIEVLKREFLGKLLMAIKACDSGFTVMVGDVERFALDSHLEEGVYVHKDYANWSSERLSLIKTKGFSLCAFDEEGHIYGKDDFYINKILSKKTLDSADAIFLWGEDQYKVVEIVSNTPNKYIVGNPRFDIAELRRNNMTCRNSLVEKTILINTRFTFTNGVRGNFELQNLIDLGVVENEHSYKEFLVNEKVIYDEFINLIELICSNSKFNVVLRPHPAENFENYLFLQGKYENLTVNNTDQLTDQIISADCVIHDGCTTAMEASALDIPVYSLRPNIASSEVYDDYANKYSLHFDCAEKLFNYLIKHDIYDKKDVDNIAIKRVKNWKNIDCNCVIECINVFNSLDCGLIDLRQIENELNLYNKDNNKYKVKVARKVIGNEFLFSLFIRLSSNISRKLNGVYAADVKFSLLTSGFVDSCLNYLASLDNSIDLSKYSFKIVSDKILLVSLND